MKSNPSNINKNDMKLVGTRELKLKESKFAYIVKSFKGYFPRFNKAGSTRHTIKTAEGNMVVQYSACYATTWKHDRLLLALIHGITSQYDTEKALAKRKELKRLTLDNSKSFMEYRFSMTSLASEVRDQSGTTHKEDMYFRMVALASTTASFYLEDIKGETFQWLAWPKFDGDDGVIYVNALFMKFLMENPLRIQYEWIMKIHDEKGGRAALLIEELKYSKRKYWADFIPHSDVMKHISPRTQRGKKITISEIQTAFIVAHEAGYPLYVAGLTSDCRLTWCKSDSKKTVAAIEYFNKSYEDGSLKMKLKEGMK